MILLLDVGNSRIKYASLQDTHFSYLDALDYQERDISERLQTIADAIAKPQAIYLASVSNEEIEQAIVQWARETYAINVIRVESAQASHGVVNAYNNPQQMGVDRWLAMLAARKQFPDSVCCVVDCGTAITIDIIDEKGQHQGGWILPGIHLTMRALFENTSKIQLSTSVDLTRTPGKSTQSCVLNGVATAVVSIVENLLRDNESKQDANMMCIFTGGDADRIFPLLRSNSKVLTHDLVLQGLALVAGDAS